MNVIVANKNSEILNGLDIDVIKNINGEFTVLEIIQSFSNFFFNKMFLDITAIKDYQDISNIQKLSMNIDMDKVILFLGGIEVNDINSYISSLISMGIYNFTKNIEGLMYLYNHSNSYKDVAHLHNINNKINNNINNEDKSNNISNDHIITPDKKIIGFKNITLHSGASTLIYMLKKQISMYKKVIAIEINKKDFIYFRENDMYSVSENDLNNYINKYNNYDVILIDLNTSKLEHYCTDIIYLIEPSTIKLNRMILINRNIFSTLTDKKVVLNKSLLDEKDIEDFEFESGVKIFSNIPPINDKKDTYQELDNFINKLGIM